MLDVFAWMQSNLINIHIPRGKRRVKPKDLRPKRTRPPGLREKIEELAQQETALPVRKPSFPSVPGDREAAEIAIQQYEDELRAYNTQKRYADFWKSPEGAKLKKRYQRAYGDD